MKTSPLYLGIDFGTTNSSVAYIYADPRHLSARYVPVEPVRITMDAENNLMAERMPSLISTRFDDRRATGLAGGWEVLRIFGRRKKAPLLRRGHELFESVKSDLGSARIYAHASSPECQTPRKVARAIFRGLLHEARERLPGLECARVRTVITVPASLNADARQETRDAAVEAGLNADLVELIDEPSGEHQQQLNRLRIQFAIQGQLLLGTALGLSGNHDGAVQVLTTAAKRADQAELQVLKNRILASLGFQTIMGRRRIMEGITTLTNVLDKLEEASSEQELALGGLVCAYSFLGDWAECERVVGKLLDVSIKTGKTGQALFSLRMQAESLLSADRLIEAKECLENAVRALQNYPDKFDEDRFYILICLVKVYSQLREVKSACQSLEEAWAVLPKATSNYSSVRSNLAVAATCAVASRLYGEMDLPEMQLKWALLGHLLTLRYGSEDSSLVAESCLCLGSAYRCNRDFARAMGCLTQAKQEEAKLPYVDRDVESRLLEEQALVYADQGDVDEAIRARVEQLAFAAQKFGQTDIRYFGGLVEWACLELFHRKSFEKATDLCQESQLLLNEHEWRDLAFLPPGQSSGFTPPRFVLPQLACLAALATTSRSAAQTAAYVCASSKGLETEVWSAQAMLSPKQSVASVRTALEDYWSSFGKDGIRAEAIKAYKLRDQTSGALQVLLEGSKVPAPAIWGAIPLDAVVLDFAQYRYYDFRAQGTNHWKGQHYAVFLTFPLIGDSTNVVVERVDLGEVTPINDAVQFICNRMSSGAGYARDDVAAALQRLGELVYAPLARYLTNVSHLIICPDGQLSRLPFEMLRVGDHFLVEEKTISYVTSGREVARLAGNPKSEVRSPKSLVMGAPDFDLDLAKAGSSRRQEALTENSTRRTPHSATNLSLLTSAATRTLSRDYRGIMFTPLPGAADEARSVAALLGEDCVLRLGTEAREAELKAVQSPRVLHLATHGFYLPDQEFRTTNSTGLGFTRAWGQPGRLPCARSDWENPLVRCGIALAGANYASQITNALAEDGILTGLEASLLNLQGTELVILSACDSGTGDVKIGEGVMSLRRAFRIAGAQTVLASHWKVNDKATSQLMTEFMRRWRAGEPRAKAWREAQLSLLHSEDFSNPYFWAAFTLTGQWR